MSRLLDATFRDRWGDAYHPVTLLDDRPSITSLAASTAARIRFGAGLAAVQVLGQCPWVFYAHLSLARVQLFLPLKWRRPYAVFVHGVEAWRPLAPEQMRVLQGAALRIANSQFTARRLADTHPEIGPVAVCPLALAPVRYPTSEGDGAPVDIGPRAVMLVGRMLAAERYKGHDELLEAWPAVTARVPGASLVFVGDGDDGARLRAKAAAAGIGQSVLFTGFVTDGQLRTLYRRAAVFAMPSRGEGFGLVYLEAMSQRLPCIGSIHDAAREIIEDGVTGFLVDQSNRDALADRIVRLLTDDEHRIAMGASGYRRFQERFSYQQFSRTLLSRLDSTFGVPAPVGVPEIRSAR